MMLILALALLRTHAYHSFNKDIGDGLDLCGAVMMIVVTVRTKGRGDLASLQSIRNFSCLHCTKVHEIWLSN